MPSNTSVACDHLKSHFLEVLLFCLSHELSAHFQRHSRGVGNSSSDCRQAVNHMILKHLDKPGSVRALMIDFSKAFDSVPFSTILATLTRFPLHPRVTRWLESYFESRFQRVYGLARMKSGDSAGTAGGSSMHDGRTPGCRSEERILRPGPYTG